MYRLLKKEDRVNLLNAYYTELINKGCKRETYKDINIFTRTLEHAQGTRYTLIVYSGTSTNPICNYYYLTEESRSKKIADLKAYQDRNEQRKNESKGKRVLTGSALCAQAIREELKTKLPDYKFSVTSENFANGNAVRISWTDGPTTKKVEEITSKYNYGNFDAMADIYENSNIIEGLAQAKFVSTNRTQSPELKAILKPELVKLLPNYEPSNYNNDLESILYRIISRTEIKDITNVKGLEHCYNNKIPGIDGDFNITFINEVQEEQTAPNIKEVEKVSGEVNIIDYSVKAFAVIGDTKPIKELLKSLGGSFNFRLSCGAGWIFSKKKLEEVQNALIEYASNKEETKQILALPAHEITALTEQVQEVEAIEEINTFLELESFKIIWHEGRHIEGATFENVTFTTWNEAQKAFLKLWEVNEKGQNGGYTKVKCEIKLKGQEAQTDRIDIANKIENGDFNPSQENICEYIVKHCDYLITSGQEEHRRHPELENLHPLNICDTKSNQYKEALKEYEVEHPKMYDNLQSITEAANSGKTVSIMNLFDIVNNNQVNI